MPHKITFVYAFCKNLSPPKALSSSAWRKLEDFWKSIPTEEIKVDKKRKMWKTTAIYTKITFTNNFSQHVQIPCLKNQTVCLNKSFAIPLQNDKVKGSHTKISHIFSRNKNASTEPHKYPINLFLMLATIFHKIWDTEKKI